MRWSSAVVAFSMVCTLASAQNSIGIFEGHSDVGTVLRAGSATFDSAKNTYTLTGSGENMWSTQDAFQFAWKKVSGDVELSALLRFLNSGGNEHKKAVLIFRQSLDPDSVYVDIALHGNGLVALQYRDEKGATTREIESPKPSLATVEAEVGGSKTSSNLAQALLRLTRRDNYIYMSLAPPARGYTPIYDGESIRIPFEGDF